MVSSRPWWSMFFIAIPLSFCRAPLRVGGGKPAAGTSSGSEPPKEAPKTKAADPPSEPAKAAVEVEKSMVVSSGAPPLVVDQGSRDAGDGVITTTDAFMVVSRSGAGNEGGPFPDRKSVV